MPDFLYLIRPARPAMLTDGPTDQESAKVAEHFVYLQELHRRGDARLVGRTLTTGPESVGLMIFSADDEAAAQAVATLDPAVTAGVFHATVLPFKVILPG